MGKYIIHGSFGVVFIVYRSVFFQKWKERSEGVFVGWLFFLMESAKRKLEISAFYQQQVFETFGDFFRASAEVK